MAKTFTFTKKRLDSLTNNGATRDVYHDAKIQGLQLRVSNSGRKTFISRPSIDGKPIMITHGIYPNTTIEQARNKTIEAFNSCSAGINPNKVKKNKQTKFTALGDVMFDYIKVKHKLKPKTVSDYEGLFNLFLLDWRHLELTKITQKMVQERHLQIGEKSPYRANATMRLLRALYNFADGYYEDLNGELIALPNPVRQISKFNNWYKEKPRTNTIQPNDLEKWFNATSNLSSHNNNLIRNNVSLTVSDLLMFILFTGLRKSEALGLLWEDVDFENAHFTVKATKNNSDLNLPLTTFTTDLLLKRKIITESQYVFTGKDGIQQLDNPYKQIKKVNEESGVKFTMHDLRRTFTTIASSLEIQLHVVQFLTNHSPTDVTLKHYYQPSIETLRKPMRQINDYILEKISGV
jgi:integrase